MENNKLELWKNRIADRKASGLNVPEWCKKNHVTKHAYYYWNKRINESMLETNSTLTFVEVPSTHKVSTFSGIKICWREIEISILNKNDISLAAEFIRQLQKIC